MDLVGYIECVPFKEGDVQSRLIRPLPRGSPTRQEGFSISTPSSPDPSSLQVRGSPRTRVTGSPGNEVPNDDSQEATPLGTTIKLRQEIRSFDRKFTETGAGGQNVARVVPPIDLADPRAAAYIYAILSNHLQQLGLTPYTPCYPARYPVITDTAQCHHPSDSVSMITVLE
jgi:hypothetical protein